LRIYEELEERPGCRSAGGPEEVDKVRFSTMMYVERATIGRTTARLGRLKIVLLILQNDYRYNTFLN
jgi:hypothetical protein